MEGPHRVHRGQRDRVRVLDIWALNQPRAATWETLSRTRRRRVSDRTSTSSSWFSVGVRLHDCVVAQSSEVTSRVASRIATVRGKRVLLDSDLAVLYGLPTMRFNEAVRRNRARFPEDFVFMLTNQEVAILKSQFAISGLRNGIEMRQVIASNAATLRRLDSLERSVAAVDAETRRQFDQVHEAILGLMVTPRKN